MPDRRQPLPGVTPDARLPRAARVRTVTVAALVLAPAVLGTAAAPAAAQPLAPRPAAVAAAACDADGPERLVPAGAPALDALDAARVRSAASGAGVVVAVVDSGVEARNRHLTAAVTAGVDLVAGGDGRRDADGHGTAVAGIVAARPLPGSAVVGLAPAATVLPVRVYDERSGPDGVRTDRIAAGLRWAVAHGADVVNVSLSSSADDPELRAAVAQAVGAGVLVVASAGNGDDARTARYPAAYPGVLGVVATDAAGRPAQPAPAADVAAPGAGVVTTFHAVGDCALGGPPQSSWATAYVSATAALVAQRFPGEGAEEWARRIVASATPTGGGVPNLAPAAALSAGRTDAGSGGATGAAASADGEVWGASAGAPVHPRAVWPWWLLGGLALALGARAARRPVR